MKRVIVLAWLVLASACVPVRPPVVAPVHPSAVGGLTVAADPDRAVAVLVHDAQGRPVAGAVCKLQVGADAWVTAAANETDGYVLWSPAPASLRQTAVACAADGFDPYLASATLKTDGDENLEPVVLVASHVDPSVIPLGQLAAIRGAMWPLGTASTCGALPFGPRPGQPDNVIATVFLPNYSPEQQLCVVEELRARGYTHAVLGPLVDSDGYHGMWSPNDWRGANFDRFLDAAQLLWDHGIAPVVFLHPDNWSFAQTRDELTPLLQQPRAQRLLRIVVPSGWEPTQYGWSSCTWRDFAKWGRETLPNALVLIHTVTDVDGPVGTDAQCDDNGHPNAEGWQRVAPWIHGWLTQSAAFANPDARGDPNHPQNTNFDNWQDNFRESVGYSYANRFRHGYAGWPTGSAWGADKPLLIYAGEYSAYWKFWAHRTEAEGVKWGDAAMAAGADGYLDSGSLPVPVRR